MDDAQAPGPTPSTRRRRSTLSLVLFGVCVIAAAAAVLVPAEDTPYAVTVVRETFEGDSEEPTAREVVSREITDRASWLTSAFRRRFEVEVAVRAEPDAGAVEARERTVETWSRGLNLSGGEPVVLDFAVESPGGQGGLAEETKAVVAKRLAAHAVRGVSVWAAGADGLIVRLPAHRVEPVAAIQRIIEDTGALEFRLVASDASAPHRQWEASGRASDPPGYTTYYLVLAMPEGPFRREPMLVEDAPQMTGECIQRAEALPPAGERLRYAVRIRFTPAGSQRFAALTGGNVGRQLAVVVNTVRDADGNIAEKGICYSAPVIRATVAGDAELVGGFGEADATALAAVLTGGPLPAPLRLREKTTISRPPGLFLSPLGIAAAVVGAAAAIAFLVALALSLRATPKLDSQPA